MTMEKTVSALSDIERTTLRKLEATKPQTIEQLSDETRLHIDSVRRAVNWLSEKKLATTHQTEQSQFSLTQAGKSSITNGLPEKLFIEAISDSGGKASLEDAYKKSQLNRPEFNAAMGLAKKNAWISISKTGNETILELTGLEQELLNGKNPLETTLNSIAGKKIPVVLDERVAELKKRGLVEETKQVKTTVTLSENGKTALSLLDRFKERTYDISGQVPDLFIGKKQPYYQFLKQITRKLTELGFTEMDSPLVTQEFFNFDVLFQPQNHPARSWTDTYQLKQPSTGKLPDKKIVAAIKASHENGGVSDSKGWRYIWSEDIAKRMMPTAHTTAHSARQLVKGIQIPGKYFSIARCFRPDVVDATHLIEFNQMEGIVIGNDLSFRHLLGMLKQFAVEFAGAQEVKFAPSYYPFTEPSVQLNARHPDLGWIELGGAGMFRPEMHENLGIQQPILAWGLGIDRLAMLKLNIKDIRYLFSDDLEWLRKQPAVIDSSR